MGTSLANTNTLLAFRMGYTVRTKDQGHPYAGWDRPGQRPISIETWRPTQDPEQAVACLNAATGHGAWKLEHHAPLDTYQARCAPRFSRNGDTAAEAMARLALQVFQEGA